MTASDPRFLPYRWREGEEWMLVRGPEDGPQVILLGPLFEEMNFTRALLAELGRKLAVRGIGSWLPDLPGTGDSLQPLLQVGWSDWIEAAQQIGDAVAARIGGNPLACSFRGGALLDHALGARACWRYAAADGADLLRHMRRAQQVADRENGGPPRPAGDVLELAGYRLCSDMVEGLEGARPQPGDARELPAAPGAGLWRRAEPGRDDALAETLVEDISIWVAGCAGR